MHGTATRRLAGLVVVAVMLLVCGGCRTPGEYRPVRDPSLHPVKYDGSTHTTPSVHGAGRTP